MPSSRYFARGQRGGVVEVSMSTDWDEEIIDEVVGYMQERMVPETIKWMQSLVPVDTGALKRSSWARARKLGKRVASLEAGADMHYFLFVEYGTGTRGRATTNDRGGGEFPAPRGYVHGPSRGNRAQPFARPAILLTAANHFKMGAQQ